MTIPTEKEQNVSERSTEHATFVIERTYDAEPSRVFNAWADPDAKAVWFGPASAEERSQDFTVGGLEHFAMSTPDGVLYSYDALYQDIVPGERIVYSYDMHRDDARISVSVTTVEFVADAAGTRLTYTEQGVFLDGHDTAAIREHGTGEMIDALGAALAQAGG